MKKILVVSFLLVVVILSSGLLIKGPAAPDGMREVKSFHKGGICMALMPECGVCPERVINDKCYVPKGTYEQYP